MFDFSTLITDRAASDLENLRALLSTPMEDWTAEQLAQFNQAVSKGAYNYTDLNRVTACMEYLDETLRSYGYETGYQRIEIPHKAESRLPYGYTELEYIESTGTQWIDSGILISPNSFLNIRVVADVEINYFAGIWSVSGCGGGHPIIYFGCSNENKFAYGNGQNDVETSVDYVNGRHTFDLNIPGNEFLVDNIISIKNIDFLTPNGSGFFFISAYRTPNNIAMCHPEKIYSYKFYDENSLVREFVPCINSEGTAGLYDLVNAQFYGNSGTGVFSPGPEITLGPDPSLDPYTWYEDDVPTAPQMAQYLNNVLSIWSTIMGDPTLPETMVNLTQEGANQIEASLIEINTAIEQIIAAMARSNSFTFWSGNRPFPTAYSNRGRNWAELDAMGTSWRNWQVASWYLLLYGNLEAEGDVT